MTNQDIPKGKRFSHVYISHPELLADSKRMRRRIGYILYRFGGEGLAAHLNRELGVKLSAYDGRFEAYWPDAMEIVELRDVLDAITVVAQRSGSLRVDLIQEVRRVFREERVRYDVDDEGGVHLVVDTAFEQVRISAIRRLAGPRYDGVRHHFEAAYTALDDIPPDAKAAMRNVFFATEGLFRLMFPKAHQLSGSEIRKHLKARIDDTYAGKKPAIHAAQKQVEQLVDWVDGAHFYRHEPGTEEPAQPPFEMAVQYVSSGASWLRWLCEFDTQSG